MLSRVKPWMKGGGDYGLGCREERTGYASLFIPGLVGIGLSEFPWERRLVVFGTVVSRSSISWTRLFDGLAEEYKVGSIAR